MGSGGLVGGPGGPGPGPSGPETCVRLGCSFETLGSLIARRCCQNFHGGGPPMADAGCCCFAGVVTDGDDFEIVVVHFGLVGSRDRAGSDN